MGLQVRRAELECCCWDHEQLSRCYGLWLVGWDSLVGLFSNVPSDATRVAVVVWVVGCCYT